MRKLFAMVLVLLLATGCTAGQGPEETMINEIEVETEAPPEAEHRQAVSKNKAEESQREDAQEMEPPSEAAPEELPGEPEDLWNQELDISYQAHAADAPFLAALARLEEEDFVELTSSRSSFEIGEYRLYYRTDSDFGPARLLLDTPQGETQLLIDSRYNLQGMFFEDRQTLCVEFTKLRHYEGGTGQYFFLDLSTGAVEEAWYGLTHSGHSGGHTVYRRHHYKFEHAADATELGEASDVFLQEESGEYALIISYAASIDMMGDRIFYLGLGRQDVYSCDLNGGDRQLYHRFASPIWSFTIDGDTVSYRDENGTYQDTVPNPYQP